MMSGQVGTFSKQNGICRRYLFMVRLCIWSFRDIAYVIDKLSGTCRRYLLLQVLCVPSVKITTNVRDRFNTYFCTKDHRIHRTISCFTLLNQASRGEGKYSLRKRRDILVSDRDPQRSFYYTTLILISDVLSSFRLFYIWFKDDTILRDRGPDNPIILSLNCIY